MEHNFKVCALLAPESSQGLLSNIDSLTTIGLQKLSNLFQKMSIIPYDWVA